jgi:hypothetical protein
VECIVAKVKVTCLSNKKDGTRCGQTVGLVDGFCVAHRPVVKEPVNVLVVCGYQWTNGRKCKEVAVKDGFCNLHRPDNFDTMPVESNANLTIPSELGDLAKSVLNFTPDKDIIDAVQEEVLRKADELYNTELLVLDGISFDEASEVIKRYQPMWKLHFTIEDIKDTRLFAEFLLDVVKMTYEEATQGLLSVTAQITDISEQVNAIVRNHPANLVPAEEQDKIDALQDKIAGRKYWKAFLLCRVDYEDIYSVKDEPVVEDKKGDKGPSKIAVFFSSLLDKGSKWMITIGMLLMLVAVMYVGEKNFDDAPKNETPSVVVDDAPQNAETEVPAVDVPVVVDDTPVDNADKSVTHGAVIDLASNDIVPVPVDTVIVDDGDTLWDIAEEVYGDGSQWTKIYDANSDSLNADDVRNMDDPGHWIHVGQVLDIPFEGGDTLAGNLP